MSKPGTVYLVGAGPGDPGLITRRGADLLGRADVVVYDRLAPKELLDLARDDAEKIDVGKRPRVTENDQQSINDLLVAQALSGKTVVRLKGGDPFIFGRGGEEAFSLKAAGIPYEVVPGVSAAVAVPAYAGIPVTHRGLSDSFTVVTGHREEGSPTANWEAISAAGGTIVVLMGMSNRAEISSRLIAGGRPPDSPVAIIRWGTTSHQEVVRTTLDKLAEPEVKPPATIVIGAVAQLDLDWFGARPLSGFRVLVTRSREKKGEVKALLARAGAEVIEIPVTEIVGPSDRGAALDVAIDKISQYDWVVATSSIGAEKVYDSLVRLGLDSRHLAGVKVAAVGPATAGAFGKYGLKPDLVPTDFIAESLADNFPPPPTPGEGKVLVIRSEVGRDTLASGLERKGWQVDAVDAYTTRPRQVSDEAILAAGQADAVTFASSSSVKGFAAAVGLDSLAPVVVCIGPVTAATARQMGIHVDVIADEHTIEGLVSALLDIASTLPK